MPVVRIAASWGADPTMLRATPGCTGDWGGRRFTDAPVDECDYLLVLNRPQRRLRVHCPPDRVWALVMEPPNERYGALHLGDRSYARVYTSDPTAHGPGMIHAHPALTWSVERDYDFLARCAPPDKSGALSWVTSSKGFSAGHRKRLAFLERLRSTVEFDLFGRGFTPIPDKWDALAPYRYSIAVENFVNPYYWTEKIADCFLAWTMPIYAGCTRITDFFPAESLVQIDLDDPETPRRIQSVIHGDAWLKHRDAIAHARDLVLNRYQLFAFMSAEMDAHEAAGAAATPRAVTVPSPIPTARVLGHVLRQRLQRLVRRDEA